MYLLNHAVHTEESFQPAKMREKFSEEAGDKLYRNDGGRYVEVTEQSGIYSSLIGYGLAAAVSDVNLDGCSDIYVSNDFHENDYLYLNNCDGTFREVLQQSMGHTSRASMGSDIADFNNDGLTDIFVLDMLPYAEEIRMSSVSSEPYDNYAVQRRYGYHPQLIRNTLQLNLGSDNTGTPLFSEIAPLAGVHATDWSWSALFMDMDNDGRKDLFVSNGIYRRPNDLDYLALVRRQETQQALDEGNQDTLKALIEEMPHVRLPNEGFLNAGEFDFRRMTGELGFDRPSFSNGAAYGDLDRDGDLDLVVNNVNMPAHIYRNNTRGNGRSEADNNYLSLRLEGDENGGNRYGIGSKIHLYHDGKYQLYEMMPTRGFLSSVEPKIHAGLDTLSVVDSIRVVWPDRRRQVLQNVSVNQELILRQADAEFSDRGRTPVAREPGEKRFELLGGSLDTLFTHRENEFNDFDRQPLVPHMLSTEGPPLAVADVNRDGMDDLFVGGAKNQSARLLLQQRDGSFAAGSEKIFAQDRIHEDVDALFFDANGDGYPDLYVVSGGNEYTPGSTPYEDRLYMNDGEGRFLKIPGLLPQMRQNGSSVAAADYDGDGDLDLFAGGRSVARNYGLSPQSYLLENIGTGKFRDVTDERAEGLRSAGMVTDALWEDVDGDGRPDLVLAGEWMPVTVFRNEGEGRLADATEEMGLGGNRGWWLEIASADVDGDGDMDLLAGNLGLNSVLKASDERPVKMYLNDFNGDGQVDPLMAYTSDDGNEYPLATPEELLSQFPDLRSRYDRFDEMAGLSVQEIFEGRLDGETRVLRAETFASSYFENVDGRSFRVQPLPERAQFAPIYSILPGDFNGDGFTDAVAGGNLKEVKPSLGGQYDAAYGWFLKGNGNGSFDIQSPLNSGFVVKGQTRDIQPLTRPDGTLLLVVSRNDSSLLFFEVKQ